MTELEGQAQDDTCEIISLVKHAKYGLARSDISSYTHSMRERKDSMPDPEMKPLSWF